VVLLPRSRQRWVLGEMTEFEDLAIGEADTTSMDVEVEVATIGQGEVAVAVKIVLIVNQ
jgi:hypothetical protein